MSKKRKEYGIKTVEYNGLKVEIVSKAGFAKVVGMTARKVEDWVGRGIFLPPTFKDEANPITDWNGEKVPRKYYMYREAVAVRAVIRGHEFKRRKVIPEELIERIHGAMEYARQELLNTDKSILDYPLFLEFRNGKDFEAWFKHLCEKHSDELGAIDFSEVSGEVYKAGDRLLPKEKKDGNKKGRE